LNNKVEQENQVKVETKIKKIYLVDKKNDIHQKKAQVELKKKLISTILDVYTNNNISSVDCKKFIVYMDRFIKSSKSKNDIDYRIASLYNYIIGKYSDFTEINNIIQNEDVSN